MHGGTQPPLRENLIVPSRRGSLLFAESARGLLTLRGNAFHQNIRSRAKLCAWDDAMHIDYIVIGVLIACMLVAGAMALHKAR